MQRDDDYQIKDATRIFLRSLIRKHKHHSMKRIKELMEMEMSRIPPLKSMSED